MSRVRQFGEICTDCICSLTFIKISLCRFDVHKSGRVLDFSNGGVPWKEHLFELEQEEGLKEDSNILYVIYTDQNGMWRIQCVPVR